MSETANLTGHVIIAGFGLPGRVVAEHFASRQLPHCVIELNPATVDRCTRGGTLIIEGDCTDPAVLSRVRIDQAAMFIIAVPDEKIALEATAQARRLNPRLKIITRCHFTSTGLEARARGADVVVVEEQAVASEFHRLLTNSF